MKRLFFVILFAIATANLYAQYFMADTVKLNATYRELLKHPESKEAQMAYFEAFPNTWMEYIITYQFVPDDKEGRKNLYSVGHKHMDAFEYKQNLIPDSLYYEKLVSLAIGARHDADAPNYLKGCVKDHMINHSEEILNALAPLRKGHRFEFWEFYFSNIIESADIEEELNRLVELHKDCHPEDVQMMKDAFKYFYNGVNFFSDGYFEGGWIYSYTQYSMADTVKLNTAYRELLKHPKSKEAQMAYFEAFPNTWPEYIVTYQFIPDDEEKRKNLYSVGHEHVHAFEYKLNLIPDSLYYEKLVSLAIGARHDADAANYLQGCVKDHMINHSEEILNALAPLRKGHRFEFWEFYFSNIIAEETIEEELNRLVELHKDCHPEDVQMMKDAFKYFYNGVNQSSVSYLEAD